MHEYNPAKRPPPREWLALGEASRIDLIAEFHEIEGEDFGESLQLHAGIHAAVETQLAENVPEVRQAFKRLRKSGLNRHDTIHAIGSVLAEHMHGLMTGSVDPTETDAYADELKRLTVERWLNG